MLKDGWKVFSDTIKDDLGIEPFTKMGIPGLGDSFMRDRSCYDECSQVGGQVREYLVPDPRVSRRAGAVRQQRAQPFQPERRWNPHGESG